MNISNKDKKTEWAKHPRKPGKKVGNRKLRKRLKKEAKKDE